MKKTLKGFLHLSTESWTYGDLLFYQCDMSRSEHIGCVLIKPVEFEVDIPGDFDPRPAQIAVLDEKQKQAAAAFAALTTEINRQISQLQALEVSV